VTIIGNRLDNLPGAVAAGRLASFVTLPNVALVACVAVALELPLFTLIWQSSFRNLAQPFLSSAEHSRSTTTNSS
jgi:hypothetical protein